MRHEWYYRENETVAGPVSLDQLKQLIQTGQLDSRTRVKRGAAGEWYAVGEIPWNVYFPADVPLPGFESTNPKSTRTLLRLGGAVCLVAFLLVLLIKPFIAFSFILNDEIGLAFVTVLETAIYAILLLAALKGIELLLDLEQRLNAAESRLNAIGGKHPVENVK